MIEKKELKVDYSDVIILEKSVKALCKFNNNRKIKDKKISKIENQLYGLISKLNDLIVIEEKEKKEENKNILQEANDIIFERKEEKERQYGPINESLEDTATIASIISNRDICIEDVFAVLIALKTSRMKHSDKRDTFLDSICYTAAYQEYLKENKMF